MTVRNRYFLLHSYGLSMGQRLRAFHITLGVADAARTC